MKILLLLIACLLAVVPAFAVNAPALFFSDLISGPASGNTDATYSATGGVYVTLYGNFLTTPTVTLNGASCLTTVSAPATWMWYQRMVVKLGTACTTGNFVVTTAGGTSNGLAFTVRGGNIYYVKSTGNDSTGTGSFSAPWLTLTHARDVMVAGDTIYDTNVSQIVDDGSGFGCFSIANSGTSGNPKSIISYPGQQASVIIGSPTGCTDSGGTAIRSKAGPSDYWVFAELTLRGRDEGINPYNDQDWRIIGNDISCPKAGVNAQSGCLDPGGDGTRDTFKYRIWGNNVHHSATDNAPGTVTGLYHGFYLSEKHHDVDIGWNTIAYVMGGRCLQVNVNVGPGDYDIHIHDNIIHDCPDDGIIVTTADPSLGTFEIYNNVIYNAGIGPSASDDSGAWNCINVQGWSESGVTGESGHYDVYNNTCYACGTFAAYNSAGGFAWQRGNTTTKSVIFRNNIIYMTTIPSFGAPYFQATSTDLADISGSNNLFFGNGTPPTQVTSSVNTNPGFVNAPGANFHLSSAGSSANGAGTTSAPLPTKDFDGLTRPSPPAIGAFEFSTSSLPPAAPAPAMFVKARVIASLFQRMVTNDTTHVCSASLAAWDSCFRFGADARKQPAGHDQRLSGRAYMDSFNDRRSGL
jgi:hypothetical protein